MKCIPWVCASLAIFFGALAPGALHAAIGVTDNTTQEFSVEPGKSYEGTVQIQNLGDKVAEAKIYQTDYLFYSDGRNFYNKPGTDPRSDAKWIQLSHDFLSVPPKGTVTLNYTIKVPQKADLKGTYWSLIMVEENAAPMDIAGGKPQQAQIGIRQVIRYGVQVIAQVGTEARPKVHVLRKEVVKKDGKTLFELDVENTGERWIVPEFSLELFDAKGTRLGLYHGTKRRIYPGTSVRVEMELPKMPSGTYKGLIVVNGGNEDVFGIRTELKL